jgi:hypothetical protein
LKKAAKGIHDITKVPPIQPFFGHYSGQKIGRKIVAEQPDQLPEHGYVTV